MIILSALDVGDICIEAIHTFLLNAVLYIPGIVYNFKIA